MKNNVAKVKVKLFGDLQEAFQEREGEIELERAPNIRGLLDLLCNSYERRQKIFDQSGQIRSDINILKNGRNIYFLDGIQTELKKGDTIAIFPPIFGG